MSGFSILIITLPPLRGGVPTKARILANHLRSVGNRVSIAHYATFSDYRPLVCPSWSFLSGKKPFVEESQCFGNFQSYAVGCFFPELEFTYYCSSELWRHVFQNFDRFIIVSGTVLLANPLTEMRVPYFVWCASTVADDRSDRARAMPVFRRIFDSVCVGPVHRFIEKKILRSDAHFGCVSSYTKETLIAAGGKKQNFDVIPIPVNTRIFVPPRHPPSRGIIGFAGRADDPRKNINLLFRAIKILSKKEPNIKLLLTGEANPLLQRKIEALDIVDNVSWVGWLKDHELPNFYQSLDVFVFTSSKEGLGISGLEAMASGVPVISTPCGGPLDYVSDGSTGLLVDFDENSLADAISKLVIGRGLRNMLGHNGRTMIEEKYNHQDFEGNIASIWKRVWGDNL